MGSAAGGGAVSAGLAGVGAAFGCKNSKLCVKCHAEGSIIVSNKGLNTNHIYMTHQ